MSSTLCDTCDKDSRYMSMKAENAKLRELVWDVWQSCPVYTADCYGCDHHRSDGGCKLYDRMCELGIERMVEE